MHILFLIFFVLSCFFFFVGRKTKKHARNLKKDHGILEGKVAYSDLSSLGKPLFSKRYRVAGKPDYIIKKGKSWIPVELKTGKHNEPQKNHVLQLAGYCHLVEENFGAFVPYGILVYNNYYQYKIPFDPGLRFEFENIIHQMRSSLKSGKIVRNHSDPRRCLNCSMRNYCNTKLS